MIGRSVPALIGSFLIGALLCLATPARADKATNLYRQGVAAFEAGRFQRSLSLLRKARPRAGSAALAAAVELYLGINHAVLGEEGKARRAFGSALRHDATLELDANQHKPAIVELFRKVRASMRGFLSIEREGEESASVFVDGKDVGQTPYRAALAIGRHEVTVQDPNGKELLSREVIVAAAKTTSVTVLESAPSSEVKKRGVKRRKLKRKSRGRIWTWVVGGGALVAAVIGTGLGVAALNAHDEYNTTEDPVRFNELAATIPGQVTASTVMFVTAGVLAAGSVALFFLEGRTKRSRKRSNVFDSVLAPTVGPNSAGLSLSGRF